MKFPIAFMASFLQSCSSPLNRSVREQRGPAAPQKLGETAAELRNMAGQAGASPAPSWSKVSRTRTDHGQVHSRVQITRQVYGGEAGPRS